MFDRLLIQIRTHRRSFRLLSFTSLAIVSVIALTILYSFTIGTRMAGAKITTITVCASGCDHTTLQAAVAAATNGDTINVGAGTYVLASTVNVNVANLTIAGASSATTIVQVAQAIGNAFNITAAGVTISDLQVQKTDVTGVHELIFINTGANNFKLQNCLIQGPDPGTPWSVNGIVSRGMVTAAGALTGIIIQNNTIKHLRQPAYFNPGTVASVLNNNVSGTRGWVVDGAKITFTGNTWGPPANQGADIALLASCNPADYPNLGALSNANGNAFISGQFAGASSGVGTVYVDDSAAPGGDGTLALPFQTIAAGVTAVLPGGIVSVADGTYVENPSIAKSLTLQGANAGTAGSATRGPESIIRTNGNQTAVVGVTAANVTINGFTIDGDDPGVVGAALASGDDSNVQYGVRPTGTVGNLTVSNNIIKKVFIGLRGDVAGQGNVVTANWFDRIGNFDFGYAVSIRNNYYANVTNNKMTKSWTGIHINNHNGAGGPASFLMTGNEIHSYAGGILYWLQYNQATGATISGNTITAETGAVANNFGILVVTNQDAVNSTFTSNAISGHDYGIGLFNVPTSSTITLGATNSISGSKLAGVLLTDNLNFNPVGTTNFLAGGPGAASTVNISGLSISGNLATGIKVEGTTNTQTLNLNGGSTISGGVTGLLVTGAPTALTGNTLNNTAFSGQSGNYITLVSSALDNLTINATAVTFDGLTGTAASVAQNLAIEDKIKHAIDDPSLGFVRVKTGGIFVTANSFNAPNTTTASIQRGIDLASANETVNVGAGTFIEDININQTLIVCGAGPASTTISGAIGGAGSTVAITANNVEFKNFKVTREGNTAATWNDPNLNTAGLSIQGTGITGANIHDNLFMQNRTGIDINNSNGHTVRNNVITDNRTGLIFRNQTDNLTVIENVITNNWTVGVLFLDGSGGSNSPVQTAANCTFSNNNISGNWYGQIVDRQSGGSLPAPGTTNLKNFSANWFGTNTPVVTTANSAEPGYAAQVPNTVPGGSATAPGGQPDVAGPASANFDLTPLLDGGTDTNVETTPGRGTYGFQGSFNVLDVLASNAQTGATGRIQEAVNLVSTGGTVKVPSGTYAENVNVNKAETLSGTPTINGTLATSATGANVSPGFSPGIINSGDLSLVSGSSISIETVSNAGPGTGHDQINVTGTVNLGGATLSLTNSFAPTGGTTFVIINNDGSDAVTGTFNGLAEGALIYAGGSFFRISYVGGSNNNDVVLTANTPPTIACPANIAQNTDPGQCTAVVTFSPTAGGTPSSSVVCIPASGSAFAKGVTTVNCTASNGVGSNATCSFTVTVNDAQNPTIACPTNITANTAAGQCSAAVTYTTPTAMDNCSGATVACVPASGSTFQKGTTTVTCTATDASNNTASCSFSVIVIDNQAPTIACPTNQSAIGTGPTVVTYPAPTANDNCSGVTTSCTPASGSTFQVGTATVTCTATDGANLTATCSFTVTVTTCTLTCPTDVTVGTTGTSSVVNYSAPTAVGSCGTVTCSPASGSSFPLGTTTVTCNSSLGSRTCAFRVTVERVNFSVADPLSCSGPGNIVNGTFTVTNNGNASVAVNASVALPSGLVGVPNSGAANVGTVSVTNASVTFQATLTAGQTATVSYQAQIGDQVTPGTALCSNLSVTFDGGTPLTVQACLTANCPFTGPGTIPATSSESSDQKAGSVLIYNVYTSGATSGNTQNTRINITNAHSTLPSFVHLFFVAEGCSVADSYLCLTANQTASFLASDLDPGTTGYLVAVAVNSTGCPISFNYLIGDEYVKFTSGHAANLGAEAFSAIPGGRPACDANSVTATLNFDGISYNRTPATLALDNVGSRADGNDTLLILNRIGGNLGIGASTLGTVFGIFYDDAENALSFSVSGSCQLRSSISNNFPRTTPRFETFIPAGRTGWLRIFSQTGAIGITGSAINSNANASSSAGAFNQGHNLHHLTLNSQMSYVIPIFPPSC